jgi:carboxypeptidase Q
MSTVRVKRSTRKAPATVTVAVLTLVLLGAPAVLAAQAVQSDVERIKSEGFERSQVMEIASWLTDVHGPRLTGSPITLRAGEWALEQFRAWGLSNPRLEWWGPFGQGWVNERFVAQVTSPVPFPVIGYPNAWSPGLDGPVEADVVISPVTTSSTPDELERHRGTLAGKIVLVAPEPGLPALFEPQALRFTGKQLDEMAAWEPPPPGAGPGGPPQGGPPPQAGPRAVSLQELYDFLLEEGVTAVFSATSRPPGGGVVFPSGGGQMRQPDANPAPPVVSVAAEHYGRMYRILEKGIPVRMELDILNRFHPDNLESFNVIAEIPGSERPEEVVMIGAHFDSWHSGTGATDNAAGSAVMMEAMRILKESGVPLRRTVKIGLWTGEEQGLIGSRMFVQEHLGSEEESRPAHDRFSVYYNVDNGTGAIRGVYTQGNEAIRPIFDEWLTLVDSDSITTRHTTLRNTGGTDHLSFDRAGLPGFQFIQDPLEYRARTHHSSMDVYERLQPVDMRHNAVVVAFFAYMSANHPKLMPRKGDPVTDDAAGGAGDP